MLPAAWCVLRNSAAIDRFCLERSSGTGIKLEDAELNRISANSIEIGRNDLGFGSGTIQVAGAIAPTEVVR